MHVEVVSLHFNTNFQSVYSILLVASVMLSIYAKLSSHVLSIRESEQQYTFKEL